MPARSINPESYFHFGKECLIISKISTSVKLQTPNHSPAFMFGEIGENIGNGWSFCNTPVCDATIRIGGGGGRSRGTKRLDESQGDGDVRRWATCDLIENMASDWVTSWTGAGL